MHELFATAVQTAKRAWSYAARIWENAARRCRAILISSGAGSWG